jgi:hypothetical protein
MENTATNLLQEFQKQKVSQESEVLQAAQRFVNQYRALSFFDPSFLQKFNTQLLACSPDVRRFLATIMGGNEVLNYLEFLEKQTPLSIQNENDTSNQSDISVDGYLPSPESDLSASDNDMISVSKQEWQELKAQQKSLMEQTQQLFRQLKNQQASSMIGRYSEILDDE